MTNQGLSKDEESALMADLGNLLGQPTNTPTDQGEEEEEKQSQHHNDDQDLQGENNKLKEENQQLKAVANKAISKKNKWKEKYSEVTGTLQKIRNGELDDNYANDYDRDMDAVKLQSEATYAQERMNEEEETEKSEFYSGNKFARENIDSIEKLVTENGLDRDSAYHLFLAKNHPERLYDVQKARQSDGGVDMPGKGRSVFGSNMQEMSTTEMEEQLKKSHANGTWSLE